MLPTFSNVGETRMLQTALGVVSQVNLTLRLYQGTATSGYTPLGTSITSDFTEATFTGYAPVTLTAASWVYGTYTAIYPRVAFTNTSAGTSEQYIWGYYVTFNDGSSTLAWAEKFDYGYRMFEANDVIYLQLEIGLFVPAVV